MRLSLSGLSDNRIVLHYSVSLPGTDAVVDVLSIVDLIVDAMGDYWSTGAKRKDWSFPLEHLAQDKLATRTFVRFKRRHKESAVMFSRCL